MKIATKFVECHVEITKSASIYNPFDIIRFYKMPLPAALAARLAKRGIIQKQKKGTLAFIY